jgi:hypothetical protein
MASPEIFSRVSRSPTNSIPASKPIPRTSPTDG